MNSPNVGDKVQFVNGGSVIPAGVVKVNDDHTVDLSYQGGPDHPAPVVARGIHHCPPGGSHGWQALEAAVDADASVADEAAADVSDEIATESPATG